MDTDYKKVVKGKLNLKGAALPSKGLKKKRPADDQRAPQQTVVITGDQAEALDKAISDAPNRKDKRTEAEKAYDEALRKREEQMVRKEAAVSHKDKISKFNKQLETMTEHNDIPKVSWTK